jgi:hypothetical protein
VPVVDADADEPVPLAAAAPPAPAPAFAGKPTTLEETQSAWTRIVAAIREKSLLCATILKEGGSPGSARTRSWSRWRRSSTTRT